MKKLVSTKGLTITEWRKQRQRGMGGSDAAAILGVSRWRGPMKIWLDKIGESVDQEETERMYWGKNLEDKIASEFSRRSGIKTKNCFYILQHDEYPWMIANVDRLIVGENAGLECKTASEYMKKEWTEKEVPVDYLVQCQHYMAVTGKQKWYLAVLIGFGTFRWYEIDRDEKLIALLIEREKEFWEKYVLTKTPPPMDGSNASTELLDALFPSGNGNSIEITTPEIEGLLKEYDSAKKTLDETEEYLNEIKNKVKYLMGDAETAFVGERPIYWKNVLSSRLDTKALKAESPEIYKKFLRPTTSRRFEIK